MTPLAAGLTIGVGLCVIGLLVCSVHITDLHRRLAVLERERAKRIIYKIEHRDEP